MTRGFFVGGNWKMNGSKAMIDGICDNLNKVNVPDNTRGQYDVNTKRTINRIFSVVVGASPCYLSYTQSKLTNDKVQVSAQNCYKAEKGAFTGEVAPEMLA